MDNPQTSARGKKFGCLHILLIIVILLLAAILGSLWWMKRNVYASEFKPVDLNATERAELETKMESIDAAGGDPKTGTDALKPEAYSESPEKRRIALSERELNALIAGDPETARHVAIDLTGDMLSVKMIAPMDAELPVLGGKTFKLNMGVSLSYSNDKPSVVIRGISIGGIPLPSAWWGNIKNKNLLEEFGESGGFWDAFSKGVERIEVTDGRFILELKE